jgi:thiamine biosynthesis lipoprotein
MRRLLSAALLLATLLLPACRPTPLQEQQAYVFGTRVEVVVVGSEPETARAAIAEVLREFDRLHTGFHAWQPSQLSALNAALAAGQTWPVSSELAELIREAQALAAQGEGLFDPGIGRLIALWGFQSDEFKARLPDPDALAAWRQEQPGMADLEISAEGRVSSRKRQLALDFGGYLKGVALDRAAAILRARGVRNALINIGGNVIALGSKDGRPWRVGIQHPRQPGPLATLELHDGEAIGTSGDYQRFFELGGRRYSHLIDPRSGEPVEHTQAVTVVIPAPQGSRGAGTLSDASSKPIFVAGPEHWRALAERMGMGLVLRVDRDQGIEITEALQRRLHWVGDARDLPIRVVP